MKCLHGREHPHGGSIHSQSWGPCRNFVAGSTNRKGPEGRHIFAGGVSHRDRIIQTKPRRGDTCTRARLCRPSAPTLSKPATKTDEEPRREGCRTNRIQREYSR